MDMLYLFIFVALSCIIFNNNIMKKKNMLKNQFVKFIILICIFNFLAKSKNNNIKYVGILLSTLFILLHNTLMYVTIDNYMI
jgi:hypothetical protein